MATNSGNPLTEETRTTVFDLFMDVAEAKAKAAAQLEENGGDADMIWRLRQAARDNYRRAELAARDLGILNAELEEASDLEARLSRERNLRTGPRD